MPDGVELQSGRTQTASASETEAFGAQLAQMLRPGDVVLVRGELGAGKTTLVRGVARALGVTDPVTSPTFSIGHRYVGERALLAHLDLYRLGTLADEDPALLADYIDERTITLIEWPEVADGELSEATVELTLAHAGSDRRTIAMRRMR